MHEQTTTITNKTGLHARPAAAFVTAARNYKSQITIKNLKTGKAADAKALMQVMTLALTQGTEISLCAEGEDETAAVKELIALIQEGFGEE